MRLRKVENKKEMEGIIDDLITQGYKVKSMGEHNALLKKPEYGSGLAHLIIFVLLGWWTFLIANLIYAYYSYRNGDEVMVKIEQQTEVA